MGESFQFIDIIFFAMIAVFLVLRLRGVLGRRDGHQGRFRDQFKKRRDNQSKEPPDDNVVPLPDQADSMAETGVQEESPVDTGENEEPLARGLNEIRSFDPDFDSEEFISGARMALEIILGAYASGDTGALKTLLSPEVLANFSQVIRDRERAGEILEYTLVGITSAEIVEAYVEGRTANITTKFVSEQINATRDENGDIVNGNPKAVINVTDFWTFARDAKSSDPNWILVATSSLE